MSGIICHMETTMQTALFPWTYQVLITDAANGILFIYLFIYLFIIFIFYHFYILFYFIIIIWGIFKENKTWLAISCESSASLADDSYEMPSLVFSKTQ